MRQILMIGVVFALAAPALAQQKADFIDGTYVFATGACDKLRVLAAGGTQAVTTVPWYVTADGISFWEGGCGFSRIRENKKKNEWHVTATCEENGNEYTETYSYRRTSPDSFLVTLTTPGAAAELAKPLAYARCDVGPIPTPQ